MARLEKREAPVPVSTSKVEPIDVFGPIDRVFDRMFGAWLTSLPLRHPMATARQWLSDAFIPVDEYHQDGVLVVRAEIPGIDPEKDVDLTVSEGMLHISVERREEQAVEEDNYVRQELHYGSFERTLPLPEGVSEADVKAAYKDGILEIRIPEGQPVKATKIAISKS